ncbi:MAG: hypothetical protein JXA21_24670 [Anaerolineae bacterium]|nr:hypothetical protein [Anaerolineae bacterium]
MRNGRYWATVVLVVAGVCLAACKSDTSPTRRECSEQLCVDLEIAGPVQAGVPLIADITVESFEAFSNLQVRLWTSDPEVQIGDGQEWWITTTTGTATHLSTTLQFPPQEGAYRVHAGVMLPSGQVVQDTVPVEISAGGAPEIQVSPQTPLLIEPVTPTLTPGAQSNESLLLAGAILTPEPHPKILLPNASMGTWVQLGSETFEGVFPAATTPWNVQDLRNDGAERYWDDDDYRAYSGKWAAWPANGGDDGIIPEPGSDNYANNMNTRMIYGPFDLSDAVVALTQFYLWREIETPFDYLAFEISHDGVAFEEISRWSGDHPAWELELVQYPDYLGDDSVWVAWRFYSDANITRQGPWIDEIGIWKFVPGEITAQGSLHFYDRVNSYEPAPALRVYLYEDDGVAGPDGKDDLLSATRTNAQGGFTFTPQVNWDADANAEPIEQRALDLYVVWEANDPSSGQRITDFDDWGYQFRSETVTDAPAGALAFDYYIPNNATWEPAMWIFQDMIRAWTYVRDTAGADAGDAAIRWEKGATELSPCEVSCFCPDAPIEGIFIDDQGAGSPDIVVHELGHQFMYNASGGWWQADPESMAACKNHGLRDAINPMCAWIEGWASFFALAVNGDACFDWESPSCQGLTENLELPTWGSLHWNNGDAVEGRVASALYDLIDEREDGLDRTAVGFAPIWDIAGDANAEYTLAEFWERWKANPNDAHFPVQTLYQNTIDYNSSPLMLLPDVTILENMPSPHAIDLRAYTWDAESDPSELTWDVIAISDWHCDYVGIEAPGYVNINIPYRNWYNACDVTVQVTDGLRTAEDTFSIQTRPVKARINLPLIVENH